jgi:hypothetical protein
MNCFSIEGTGAQLSEEVTLKHAHSSRFAHPTIGTRTCPGKKRFARSDPPGLLQPFEVVLRGGLADWAFFSRRQHQNNKVYILSCIVFFHRV